MDKFRIPGWSRTYWVLVLTALVLALDLRPAPADDKGRRGSSSKLAAANAKEFFGLTNLWTLHLAVSEEEWQKFEPTRPDQSGASPRVRRNDGLLKTRGPRFDYARADLEIGGETYRDVGMRYKGNGAFGSAPKHPFKIDFNKFVDGQRFHGVTQLSLNNNVYDTSFLREALSYHVFRQAGVPAPRTAFAKVYLTVTGTYTRKYLGLYTVVEAVDESFLRERFGNKKGLLLKPDLGNRSPDFGDKWESYQGPYQQKAKGPAGATNRFIEYTRLVNRADDKTFRERIASFIDVDEFLGFLAVNTVLANLDSFLGMGKNFYIYLNPATQKLVWMPWDLDLSFGGYFFCGTVEDRIDLSIRHPFSCGDPLVERLLSVKEFHDAYCSRVAKIVSTSFRPEKVRADIEAIAGGIRAAVLEEGSVSVADFERSLSDSPEISSSSGQRPGQTSGPVVGKIAATNRGILEPSLKTFVAGRVASVQDQLNGKSEGRTPSFWRR